MADLSPSLKSIILPRLGQNPGLQGGIREWLTKEPYTASFDSTSNITTLYNIDLDKLTRYVSFDYERFALSSLESFYLSTLDSKNYKLVSWPLIKIYYSAFFAAHAIMRATGEGVVKIESKQASTISQIISLATGTPFTLSAAMYQYKLVEISPGQTGVQIQTHSNGAGVHEGFWRAFLNFLNDRSAKAVNEGSVGATDFVSGATELEPALRGWLSTRRNDINYQHAFGVWFPLKDSKKLNYLVQKSKFVPSRLIDVRIHHSEIESFLNVSRFICCLNWEIADFVAARCSASSTFGAKWKNFGNLHK